MIKRSFLCVFIGLSAFSQACAENFFQKENVLFYESFDNTLKPVIAGTSKLVSPEKADFEKGIVKEAVSIKNEPVKIIQAGNLNRDAGSVSFWIKLKKRFQDMDSNYITIFKGPWIQLTYSKRNWKLYFMTGRIFEKEGFKWNYSCWTNKILKWRPEEWHSVGISWNSATGVKKLFIDGEIASSVSSQTISPRKENSYFPIMIGGENFPCAIDEWAIMKNELTSAEMSFIGSKPLEFSQILHSDKKATLFESSGPSLKFTVKRYEVPEKSILKPGDVFVADIPVRNSGNAIYHGKVTFELIDFWNKARGEKTVDLKLAPGESKDLKLEFKTPNEKGVFKIAAKFEENGKVRVKDISSCATWPEVKREPVQDSFFGNHVNSWYGGKFVRQAARLGQGWQRVHDMLQCTWWKAVQPEPGEFKWNLDKVYEEYKKRKMPVLGCLTGTPYWAVRGQKITKKGGARGYSSPPDLELWRKYVEETARHYKDYIKYWEVYNEPAVSGFWNGSPAELAELNKIAYEAVKKVDPGAIVMTAGYTYPSWRWHEEHAKAGALKYVDVISIHIFPGFEFGENIEEADRKLKENLKHFRELSKKYAGKEKPIWSTESAIGDTSWFRGLDFPELPPEDKRKPNNANKGACRVVKGSALLQAEGVKKHFYYWQGPLKHGSRSYLNTSMLDVNDAPRPKLIARIAMAEQVDDCNFNSQVYRAADGRFWAMIYEKKDKSGSVVLWWCGNGGKISVDVKWPGEILSAVNIMGNEIKLNNPVEITEEPCYVNVKAPASSVKKALESAKIKVLKAPEKLKLLSGEDKPDVPFLPDYVAPSENPSGIFFVNMRPYCNMGFADEKPGDGKGGWADEGSMNDMAEFPLGMQKFYGVPFEIINPKNNKGTSIITLKSKSVTPTFPEKVVLPLNRKARGLYFLQAAAWGSKGKIGKYVINYQDGSKVEIANEIPVNNGNWWNGLHEDEISKPVPVKVTNTATGKPSWRYVRVFEWSNPYFKKELKSVEFISNGGMQAPILLAITGVEW